VVLQRYSPPVERRSARLDDVPFEQPTVWGLKPNQIHDWFWAARGVQPIRCGEETEIAKRAKLFLLTPSDSLVKFNLRQLMETMNRLKNYVKPQVVFVKLKEMRGNGYRERIVTDDQNRFLRFQRMYGGVDRRSTNIALTPELHIARAWQSSPDLEVGFALLREHISEGRLAEISLPGCAYNMVVARELIQCVRDLIDVWEQPNAVLTQIHEVSSGVWAAKDTCVEPDAKLVGPIWIGAGRVVDRKTTIVGPAVLWDDPAARPRNSRVAWEGIKTRPTRRLRSRRERKEGFARSGRKRAFDILFALFAIAITAPLYPLIMLAIWLADGRPFFFAHRRETLGGVEYPCLKFRSMFKNAEQVKADYQEKNQVDGPQFFIEDDPRVTPVGRFLRKSKLDELPQFLNVLVGHMSVVGPRPSPFVENQFCPAWREARLSVRPGITGLWQLKRTRQKGLDFQEWIKYDLEYVENSSWRLDLWILWHTIRNMLRDLF
jgi:lipopolysaccharide/colanic/teichoic acid biosynthesis glycosyltransferase